MTPIATWASDGTLALLNAPTPTLRHNAHRSLDALIRNALDATETGSEFFKFNHIQEMINIGSIS